MASTQAKHYPHEGNGRCVHGPGGPMGGVRMRRFSPLQLLFFLLAFAGCTDEKIVFRDRELFAPVQSAASGFVGYSDSTAKLTVCGNCHIGQQDEWDETAHSNAWATLANAPGKQALCEACHTVTQRGNLSTTAGGWENVKD